MLHKAFVTKNLGRKVYFFNIKNSLEGKMDLKESEVIIKIDW